MQNPQKATWSRFSLPASFSQTTLGATVGILKRRGWTSHQGTLRDCSTYCVKCELVEQHGATYSNILNWVESLSFRFQAISIFCESTNLRRNPLACKIGNDMGSEACMRPEGDHGYRNWCKATWMVWVTWVSLKGTQQACQKHRSRLKLMTYLSCFHLLTLFQPHNSPHSPANLKTALCPEGRLVMIGGCVFKWDTFSQVAPRRAHFDCI